MPPAYSVPGRRGSVAIVIANRAFVLAQCLPPSVLRNTPGFPAAYTVLGGPRSIASDQTKRLFRDVLRHVRPPSVLFTTTSSRLAYTVLGATGSIASAVILHCLGVAASVAECHVAPPSVLLKTHGASCAAA